MAKGDLKAKAKAKGKDKGKASGTAKTRSRSQEQCRELAPRWYGFIRSVISGGSHKARKG